METNEVPAPATVAYPWEDGAVEKMDHVGSPGRALAVSRVYGIARLKPGFTTVC